MIELIHTANGTEHTHTFPDDWIFGGPNEMDPRADPRWRPTTYEYYSGKVQVLHVTQVPLCDEEALDYFAKVSSWGNGYDPVWCSVKRPDQAVEMLPFTFDAATGKVHPK